MMILPRQARDKHRESSTQKKTVLLQDGAATNFRALKSLRYVRKRISFAPFDT